MSRTPRPKALEASYSGRIFRSRLEARWAILLDLLEINWDYEPSHYQVGPELYYLPDFYLPQHRLWLEVKGEAFLDAGSMAKCLAAVAGPTPIPLREAPYTASDRLLLAGSLQSADSGRPLHTLITDAGERRAHLGYATVGPEGVVPLGRPWSTMEASGVKMSRRPAAALRTKLLSPHPVVGSVPADVAAAYRAAASARFDDSRATLAASNNPALLARLALRRAGRPLGRID
ncbi:hypothetical protein [Arthrobacter sp. A2-55]|uniref:hypothetical protein n=1 Tax=Arthrobacter sp. A2-55 TaxID=2897337 RepID=UPI0021CD7DF1|nr:hypothetical protein [Arthrobacter sp. A2-55]MCU6480189.1 hypothetical protein [Arthrobacter sp. A2-55]